VGGWFVFTVPVTVPLPLTPGLPPSPLVENVTVAARAEDLDEQIREQHDVSRDSGQNLDCGVG